MKYTGRYMIKGTSLVGTDQQEPIGLDGETYEVMRIERRTPLFIDDHLARFKNTIGPDRWQKTEACAMLPQLIARLVESNDLSDCELRLCISQTGLLQMGFVESDFPTAAMYAEGVHCELLPAMRENPTVKIYHAPMRAAAHDQQQQTGAYESLLVNTSGQITEGSRSNVFFVRHGELFTAPDDVVLHGVMRKKVIEIAEKLGIIVNFVAVASNEINAFEAAFLSSTPMRILPIRSIDEVKMKAESELTKRLMLAMHNIVEKQIHAI